MRKHHVLGITFHLVGVISLLALTTAEVSAAVWTANGTGLDSWNTAGNWDTGVPNSAGAVAQFITKPSNFSNIVRVDSSIIVGTIDLQVPTGMTLAAAAGQQITLQASTGNAKINCITDSYLAPTISAPLTLNSDLDILVAGTNTFKETLNLSGLVTKGGTAIRNVNINDNTNGGILQIASTGGIDVNGTVTINNGVVEVLPGGRINADVLSGIGRINIGQTGGLTAHSIDNLGVLGLGSDVNLTIGGTNNPSSLTVHNVTGTSSGSGTLTLDGGILRYYANVAVPVDYNLVNDVAFQITPNGGTIDGNGGDTTITSPIVGTSSGQGILTIKNTTSVLTQIRFEGIGSDYGGTNITGTLNTVSACPESLSGPINVGRGNSLRLEPSSNANVWSQKITLNGPPSGGDYQYASLVNEYMDGGSTTITGTLTLTDDAQAGPSSADSFSHIWNEGEDATLKITGKITGGGNLAFGPYSAPDTILPTMTIEGTVANDYGTKSGSVNIGVTLLKSGNLHLAKPNDVVAIPTAEMRIGVLDANDAGSIPTLIVENRNQFNPQCVIKMFVGQGSAKMNVYASQTIGGLEAESSSATPAMISMTRPSGDPQRVIDLTIDAATDHSFTGSLTGAGNLVKNGDGKQSLALFTAPYAGTTTINAGTLAFSGSLMPSGLLALAGAVSGEGTLEVFDDGETPTVLQLTHETSLANAVIGATDTLELASGTANTIGSVIGDGTLHVTDGTTLTTTSIELDSLVIGGVPTAAAANAVPEPNALALLAIAGIAIAWVKVKKS